MGGKLTWISSHFVFDFCFLFFVFSLADSSDLCSENSQTKAKPREVAVIPKLNRDYSSAKQEVVSGGEGGGGVACRLTDCPLAGTKQWTEADLEADFNDRGHALQEWTRV